MNDEGSNPPGGRQTDERTGLRKVRRRILLVEDNQLLLRTFRRALEHEGIDVIEASNGWDALELTVALELDLVLSDVRMPDLDGLELLELLRERKPELPVVLMSGLSDDDLEQQARRLGAAGYLRKPLDMETLRATFTSVLGRPLKAKGDSGEGTGAVG